MQYVSFMCAHEGVCTVSVHLCVIHLQMEEETAGCSKNYSLPPTFTPVVDPVYIWWLRRPAEPLSFLNRANGADGEGWGLASKK